MSDFGEMEGKEVCLVDDDLSVLKAPLAVELGLLDRFHRTVLIFTHGGEYSCDVRKTQ